MTQAMAISLALTLLPSRALSLMAFSTSDCRADHKSQSDWEAAERYDSLASPRRSSKAGMMAVRLLKTWWAWSCRERRLMRWLRVEKPTVTRAEEV